MAEHATLGRRAAIKVLHPGLSGRPDVVTRFFNEARAATRIADPGIVQIFDFGSDAAGCAYIVMELLEGETLDKRLTRLGALPVTDALRIMRQVATSVGAAHAHGIIHRDLKPENLFLVRDVEVAGGERAKLLDFGIAKLMDGQANLKTQTAAMLGTPMFMSPEQCRGAGQVDQRADIYSLGCVLFQLVTGRPPFDAEGVGEIIAMHLREPAPLASSVAAGIPSAVDELIARCLAKDPAARFSSGAELATAIAQIHPSNVSQITSAVMVTRTLQPGPTTLSSAAGASEGRARSRRWWVAGCAVAAIAGGFGIARLASQSDPVVVPTSLPAPPPPAAAAIVVEPAVRVPSEREDTQRTLAQAIEQFSRWAKANPAAACLDQSEVVDGWGTRFRYTCSGQPDDQLVGVISAGPDRVFDTADDLRSWQLGDDTLALARGARWKPVASIPKPPKRPTLPAVPSGDGIPDTRQ